MAATPTKDGPRINEDIRAPRVLLIDENGEKQGEMPLAAALDAATEAGLDLVEIAGTANPPVVKILDYGKFKFQEQKKKNEARKRQKVVELKEIKLRPMIDDHDYDVKARAMTRALEKASTAAKYRILLSRPDLKTRAKQEYDAALANEAATQAEMVAADAP
jgi:translation initiation factor IF-3